MGITPGELRDVTRRVVEHAAPAYLMAVAGNADPMLGYLTTSFREHPPLRRATGRRMTSRFERRLADLGVDDAGDHGALTARLYAAYERAGGHARSVDALVEDAHHQLEELRQRGFDLGGASDASATARIEAIYQHARQALYAELEEPVLRDALPRYVCVTTRAIDRDGYLAHPPAGEQLRDSDVAMLRPDPRTGLVQIVVSDGLNANAVNEQLRRVMPPLRQRLADSGCQLATIDVVVTNGRVRAGYHVGQLVDAAVVVHLIGERPGTGLNTLSAYITYGRDPAGASRWSPALDHSATTAICGIHPAGKPPAAAAVEIARVVVRALETRRSGVGV
jgi:ethanolamine ammonia-lyase small subunit